jgi:hypothetical protein
MIRLSVFRAMRADKSDYIGAHTEHVSVIRYVATYVDKDGTRTLMLPPQGSGTFATREEAQAWLDALLAESTAETIRSDWGPSPRFDVRPCRCSPSDFTPQEIYFECW